MENLCRLVLDNEQWLMKRILAYAKDRGYAQYTSTLVEPWRQSISGLTDPLVETLKMENIELELSPSEDYQSDPAAQFGILEAKLHRQRGVSLGMFMGLMKYYRQTYLDLLREKMSGDESFDRYFRAIDRFFDRVEIGYTCQWASLASGEADSELQEANRRITNEKNKYLTVFESLPNPVLLLDEDGLVENYNLAASELFFDGQPPGTGYYGKPAGPGSGGEPRPGPETPDWLRDAYYGFLDGRSDKARVEREIECGGEEKNYTVSFSRMLDISGKFTGIVMIFDDITDRRRAERIVGQVMDDLSIKVRERTVELEQANQNLQREIAERIVAEKALEASESKYRSMMQAMEDAVYICNQDRIIEYMNPAMIQRMGGDKSGELCHQAIYKNDNPCSWCVLDRVCQGANVRYEIEDPRTGRVLNVSNDPLHNDDGSISKLTIYRDITDHHQAKNALRESERQYRTLVETMNEGLMILDQYGIIKYANRSIGKMLGYPLVEIIGKKPADFMDRDNRQTVADQLARRRQGDEHSYELEWLHADGSTVSTRISPTIITNKKGEYSGSFGLVTDITAQKRSEEEKQRLTAQLHQSQKMEALGTLAGGIAHDFNNILGAILGYSELAAMDLAEGSEEKQNVEQVIEAAERATDLVRQILSFSRHAQKKKEPLRTTPIIKEALKLLRASIPANVDIRFSSSQGAQKIMADPTQLHQVIMNLCTNAVHAMGEGGGVLSVKIDSAELNKADARRMSLSPGSHLMITVSDTGIGMSREVMDRIFDPFYTTKEVGQGTGLGLSVVHGIIKELGGFIKVYSAESMGTTFTVYLPVSSADTQGEGMVAEKEYPKGTERILFVDDEESLSDIGRRILEPLGYQVTAVNSSGEALRMFSKDPWSFDLVVSDFNMPELNGGELVKKILALRPDMPVILCSGFSERLSENDAFALGVKWFLMKPVMSYEMARAVRSVLDGINQPQEPPVSISTKRGKTA